MFVICKLCNSHRAINRHMNGVGLWYMLDNFDRVRLRHVSDNFDRIGAINGHMNGVGPVNWDISEEIENVENFCIHKLRLKSSLPNNRVRLRNISDNFDRVRGRHRHFPLILRSNENLLPSTLIRETYLITGYG